MVTIVVKIEKYEEQGLNEEDAEDKALFKLRPANLKSFLEYYTQFIKNMFKLKEGLIHNQILKTIDSLIAKGFKVDDAISLAVKQNKEYLEHLLWPEDSDSEDEEDERESSPASDDEENEEGSESEDEGEEVEEDQGGEDEEEGSEYYI